MTTLYAQPYDNSATGFYFDDADSYARQAQAPRNECGQPVEEFEIQFIDGESIDPALGHTWRLNQANLTRFFEIVDDWSDDQKQRFIIAMGECGYSYDPTTMLRMLGD